MKTNFRSLLIALPILLAACTSAPSKAPRQPAINMPPVANTIPAPAPAVTKPATSLPTSDMWEQLRGSFAMADCDADPAVLTWAKRYTRNPQQFNSQLQAVLPQLVYVKQVAAQYDVAGEFVLLPWVESQFQVSPGRKHRPAGMWQIMPATAGSMGLRVDGHYDGRLDVPAAANAVMKLLKQYHDQFNDWRVADYAYNAGEFKIKKIVEQRGMPADEPVIPRWPVQSVTREHLTKLLAIACVVREPDRFNVSLPTLPDEQQLVQVKIPHSMPIARAADHAGMPVSTLKGLNAGFRNDVVDANASSYLLMPLDHVQQFRDALLAQPQAAAADDRLIGITSNTPPGNDPPATKTRSKTHTVTSGDSLWQIARRYSVNIKQLQRWNHLVDQSLKPGQVLQVSETH